jgi:PAS domain S-box-containing protein
MHAIPLDERADSGQFRSDLEFRRLLENLPAAAYICDADGLITYFNRRAVDLWGREPELNSPTDRFCGSFKLFSPTGSPITHDLCWMALALREGKEYNGQEIVVERPDGTRVTVLAHANPYFDEAGKLRGAVNVLVDITERKQAEEVRARLAAVVESSEDAIVSKTLDGRITSWNAGAEKIFGYTAAEAVGQPITLIVPPERHDEEREILARLSHGQRIEHYETVRVAKDGRRIDISVTISPVRDGAGRIVGASKVGRDITERKRAEAALREADRRKTEFLAVLAHELRNPLAPLRNGLEILQMPDADRDTVERTYDVMNRQLGHLVRLVDDLLDLSRINNGKIELRKERIELAGAVQDAVEASRPLVESSGHELTVTFPTEPLWVDGDRTRLTQVFANLLNNSARYTERGGRITLRAERRGGEAVVTVADTGIGIPADMLPRIFDMFTQADRPQERSKGGLGIGLSLVRGLVEMHKGSIEAKSGGTGKGSEFVVRLPLQPPPDPGQRPAEGDREARCPAYRILVVDDNEDAADSLGTMLELMGHTTRTAYDGLEAVSAAESFRPDVVLLDIGLPLMNGYDACRQIRARPWGRQMVIIAQTGWGQDDDRSRSQEAGFDFHLVKPVAPAALEKLLAGLSATGR